MNSTRMSNLESAKYLALEISDALTVMMWTA